MKSRTSLPGLPNGRSLFTAFIAFSCLVCMAAGTSFGQEPGFVRLFDGQTLNGWTLADKSGEGYGVKDGVIFCARGGGGNLLTEKKFSDFVLRFEFKLEDGSNNGVGIRAPAQGDAAYLGMEIQILDEGAADRGKWGALRPAQYHGSIYDVVAAKKGALKPPGEWNEEEITALGRRLKVVVNGQTTLEADLNEVTDPATLRKHPGLLRARGHIGFLGHGDYVEFRNLRLKELPAPETDNTPPPGFVSLFNGKDLSGWKGLVADPPKRAAMTPATLATEQEKADQQMRADWKIENGTLAFRGSAFNNLCSAKDYADFELLADWRIEPHADSGLYLRGSPQVQIWDPHTRPAQSGSEVGSGGLYNNKTNASKPLKVADKPVGEWNRFRILMAGERVHVFLNDELVANDVTLENYWDRTKPMYASGPIELQAHRTVVWFKNLYLREIKRP